MAVDGEPARAPVVHPALSHRLSAAPFGSNPNRRTRSSHSSRTVFRNAVISLSFSLTIAPRLTRRSSMVSIRLADTPGVCGLSAAGFCKMAGSPRRVSVCHMRSAQAAAAGAGARGGDGPSAERRPLQVQPPGAPWCRRGHAAASAARPSAMRTRPSLPQLWPAARTQSARSAATLPDCAASHSGARARLTLVRSSATSLPSSADCTAETAMVALAAAS